MPPRKQAERNAARKAAKGGAAEEPEPATSGAGGKLTERLVHLAKGSALFHAAPHLPGALNDLKSELQAGGKPKEEKAAEKAPEKEDETTAAGQDEGEAAPDAEVKTPENKTLFHSLKARLTVINGLGLFASGDDAKQAFQKFKSLEFDGGPRAKKKGTPGMDRLLTNFHDHLPQYVCLLFALMVLRSLLFRSWFACLPWLFLYQVVSCLLPLERTEQVPVPLEKVPQTARGVATAFLHGLVWLFFVYEVLFRAWWLEWVLVVVLFTAHAYAFRPIEA
mmetsp:Transcript_1726/g.5433  ORF Transcript_1726/g.5433 Transcript_1726/m.5433 type:complete len:278 (-) Transcript_1726:326-1159(-)